jgi:hypothetical protein
MSAYRDPVIQKVIDLLEQHGPSKLKGRYINGDVLLPNKSELPLCYVAKDSTTISPATNMEDEHLIALVATVILDFTQDLDGAYDLVAGTPEIYEFCEGRSDDYQLLEETLLYQLRKSQQLDEKLWIGVGTPVEVSYGIGVDRRGPGSFSVEAVVRFNVRLHVPLPGL